MSITEAAGVTEVTELESWLDRECGCEIQHEIRPCSFRAVAVLRSCTPNERCCQNGVTTLREKMLIGGLCWDCDRPVSECWQIIPI